VVLEIPAGRVQFAAGERADTVVEVLPADPPKNRDVKAAEPAVVTYEDKTLRIRTHEPHDKLFGASGALAVTVELAAGSRVEAKTAGCEVRGVGRLGGPSEITTARGAIRIAEATGRAGATHPVRRHHGRRGRRCFGHAGLRGTLSNTDGTAARYWAPLGEGRYDAVATRAFPIEREAGGSGLALMDLDADGELDLVVTEPARAGFYGNDEGLWEPFRPFTAAPTALAQPEAQYVDLDGNGDGHLSREEFAGLWTEFWAGDDPSAAGSLVFGWVAAH